jgi:pimeloyl-ACP methyl ester carboxylesterase
MNSSILHSSRTFRIATLVLVFGAAAVPRSAAAVFLPPPMPAASFDAGMIHIDRYGSGSQALVLIPGLACGPWVWYETIAKFAPHYIVYAITLPGFDGRAASDRKDLFASFAKDFWAMLADQNIKSPIVIGHSLGGTLAIALAEEHPERLAGIVAVDGLPVFPTLAFASPEQRAAAASQFASVFASLDSSKKLANQEHYMRDIGTIRPELVEPAAQFEAKSDMQAVAAWVKEDISSDLRPQLARIVIPFLEVMPYNPADAKPPMNYSQEQTLAFYRSLVAGAPKVSVVVIAPSRHFAMLDQPAAFEKEIEHFLVSVNRP